MSVLLAYISVIMIWSTTPLAIQWSSHGVGFIFGVSSRMILGALVCVSLLALLKKKLPLHREALTTYIAAATGIFGAMFCVYWGSQYIPSGLVAVIFGLTPIVTAFMSHFWLNENSLTMGKLTGAALGFVGILVIFKTEISVQGDAYYGIFAVLMSVFIHSGSAIWVKRVGVRLPALELTSGALLVVVPLYLITWFILDGQIPSHVDMKVGGSILYLGVIGSVIGFTLYFYILRKVEANRVALITLVTPVLALLLGQTINGEQVPMGVWYGASCIIFALVFHQWGDRLVALYPIREKASEQSSN